MVMYRIQITFSFMPELPTYVKYDSPIEVRLTQDSAYAKIFLGYVYSLITMRCIQLLMRFKHGIKYAQFKLIRID